MKLRNRTQHKIPLKWLRWVLRSLNINPIIEIEYAENPKENKIPNYKHKIGGKYHDLDGLAYANRVYLWTGKWRKGEFSDYTLEFIQHVLLHELRHVYFFKQLETEDLWPGCSAKEKLRREEIACSKYANKIMGVRKRADLPRYNNNAKSKILSSR